MSHRVANEILIPEIARLLREGKRVRFTPTGVSMRPFIEGGRDSVELVAPQGAVGRGDVVLAEIEESRYVLHRVLRCQGDELVLQGDGNLQGVEECRQQDVLGVAVRVESPSGRRKPLTRGRLWQRMQRSRWLWLKVYRRLWLPLMRRI